MILVDTSVWVGYLRGDETRAVGRLSALIEHGAVLTVTEPVVMELCAGAARPAELARVEALTNGLPLLPIEPAQDFHGAAALYRASAANGNPIRSMVDCLIAAVAIRRSIPVLHQDRDFAFLAAISPLREEPTDG